MSTRPSSDVCDALLAALGTVLSLGVVAVVAGRCLPKSDPHAQVVVAAPAPFKPQAAKAGQQKHLVTGLGGTYGAPPLRASLSDKPFCQTSLGRENHRFALEAVNEFHLYDFYARQAAHYLEHPQEKPDFLPPFTELDGGRLGHWGGTNEPGAGALERKQQEVFGTFTQRSGGDLQAVKSGSAKHPAVLLFNGRGDLREIRLDAGLAATGNGLTASPGVDTLGFNLAVVGGRTFLQGGGPLACRHAGTYLHGDKVIYRRRAADGAELLDAPQLFYTGPTPAETPVAARHLEWLGQADALEFQLSAAAGPAGALTPQAGPPGCELWSMPASGGHLHHLVWQEGAPALQLQVTPAGGRLKITGAGKGSRLHVLTWVDGEASGATLAAALRAQPATAPGDLIHGGPQRFPETIRVTGVRNADRAMAGGAYEMDDIPVPSDNPWRAPMCLSGIAFDKDGAAYVCSMTGDVWKVTGLNDDLDRVIWKRYASGLPQPMGMQMEGGNLCVSTAHHIVRLHDLNNDGEADYTEIIDRVDLPNPGGGCSRQGLGRDSAGNFFFAVPAGIFRLSPDGQKLDAVGGFMRNPLGLATRADGLCLSDSSEGDTDNGTCSICESAHPENAQSPAKRRRILYLPRGLDNSPGGRQFLSEPRFGPLGQGIVGLSYGTGTHYLILRDPNDGAPQAAMVPLPGDFAAGMVQLQINPADGQLYTVGIDGWGDYAVAEGALHRVRWTGKKTPLPVSWEGCNNGILVRFSEPLSTEAIKPESCFVQQWNNVDSAHTYGSPDYSVKKPDQIGHDRLRVAGVRVLEGGRALFVEIPDLLPAMSTQVYALLKDASGAPVKLDLYATLNRLRPDLAGFAPGRAGKPRDLVVPTRQANGNTYQNVLAYFDLAAGRNTAARPVGAQVTYKPDALNYAWIRENLLTKQQCFACHGPGTQHDYSTYAGLMTKVNVANPGHSPLLGMLSTQSMPPYPMPTVHPTLQQAVLEWIKKGAPE